MLSPHLGVLNAAIEQKLRALRRYQTLTLRGGALFIEATLEYS